MPDEVVEGIHSRLGRDPRDLRFTVEWNPRTKAVVLRAL